MSADSRDFGSELVERPVGDLLEEILARGASGFPRYVAVYPAASAVHRVAILLAGLALGRETADAIRDQLARRDSLQKWALAVGMGEMGHPEVEGYFARVLREQANLQACVTALGCLGRIRGPKSLPLVTAALEQPFLFDAACRALASFGGREAATALREKASEFSAFRALCELGAPEGRELFLEGIEREPPWNVEAAQALGRLGEATLAPPLVPLLRSKIEGLASAAFAAYASLGAPGGTAPLLEVASQGLAPWMLAPLGQLGDPEVEAFLVRALQPPAKKGFLAALFSRRKAREGCGTRELLRALRRAEGSEALAALVASLKTDVDAGLLRELTSNPAVVASGDAALFLLEHWGRGSLVSRFVAAVGLLRAPAPAFVSEALRYLSRPGFLPLDTRSPLVDPAYALAAYAQENNPALLAGGFLDSGLVEIPALIRLLEQRFVLWGFPSDESPGDRFHGPSEAEMVDFLSALADAQPGVRSALWRFWGLLSELEDRGDSLLDLFLCSTESHRGGLQRTLFRGLFSAMGILLQGKDDRFLGEIDDMARHIPESGPMRAPLLELFDRARRSLMAECRDMSIYSEGIPRGDMVLVEQLRSE